MYNLIFNEQQSHFALISFIINHMTIGDWIPIEYIEEYKHIKELEKDKYGNYLYKK